MTSASMTFGRPARLTAPRGSLWFAAAAGAVINGLRRLDQWQLKVSRQEPQTAEEVQPGTPASLHSFAAVVGTNRLGFAQWLVSLENPLTARVMANRIWQYHFGKGIVDMKAGDHVVLVFMPSCGHCLVGQRSGSRDWTLFYSRTPR